LPGEKIALYEMTEEPRRSDDGLTPATALKTADSRFASLQELNLSSFLPVDQP
jgi:hypothetical protein